VYVEGCDAELKQRCLTSRQVPCVSAASITALEHAAAADFCAAHSLERQPDSDGAQAAAAVASLNAFHHAAGSTARGFLLRPNQHRRLSSVLLNHTHVAGTKGTPAQHVRAIGWEASESGAFFVLVIVGDFTLGLSGQPPMSMDQLTSHLNARKHYTYDHVVHELHGIPVSMPCITVRLQEGSRLLAELDARDGDRTGVNLRDLTAHEHAALPPLAMITAAEMAATWAKQGGKVPAGSARARGAPTAGGKVPMGSARARGAPTAGGKVPVGSARARGAPAAGGKVPTRTVRTRGVPATTTALTADRLARAMGDIVAGSALFAPGSPDEAGGLCFVADAAALDLLVEPAEGELIRTLGDFPGVVETAATLREPHRICRYLETLAGTYHRFYDRCRILPQGDEDPTALHGARLALCDATRQVVANGLDLVGVSAPERM